jgi:hypothetical protein
MMVGGSCRWSPASTALGARSSAPHVATSRACGGAPSCKDYQCNCFQQRLVSLSISISISITLHADQHMVAAGEVAHSVSMGMGHNRPYLRSLVDVHHIEAAVVALQVAPQGAGQRRAHHLRRADDLGDGAVLPLALLLLQLPQLRPQAAPLRIILSTATKQGSGFASAVSNGVVCSSWWRLACCGQTQDTVSDGNGVCSTLRPSLASFELRPLISLRQSLARELLSDLRTAASRLLASTCNDPCCQPWTYESSPL